MDALHWYGTWTWLDALMGCAFQHEWCAYVTADGAEPRAMGRWSNGIPVAEAVPGAPAGPATPAWQR